ncbi:hypothetical protein A1O1_00635 [Capronia coronata CBS 617.96]|uniref:Uncharacterized protein n=1 Tax=Capronia coronata CBS 617.96 TaxID=1182541 RepID=W9YSK2_9EURO|nr:uncharacterized protein A1O1_00635 [Capronia coronata CBS 617.96]EXJ95513.1 hypothetical protein A1O1_00635 [Capronia coronata CBS 617.96]
MAPVISHIDIPDLQFSSLELDSRSSKADVALPATPLTKRSFLFSDSIPNPLIPRNDDASPILSPMDTFNILTARDAKSTSDPDPGAGSIDPTKINMKGIQALFAIIGAAFVLGAIWFFFWAKNGGFQWRKGDWEDYKSTVLRRKGPNGTTLSNATKSTILGGGSVVGDGYSDKDAATTVDGNMTETMTDLSSEAPIIKEKRGTNKLNKLKNETSKARKIREAKEAQWEGAHDNDVRAYRHEKAARVGGINKDSDALFYGTDYSATERSCSDMGSIPQGSAYGYEAGPRQSSRQSSPDKRQTRRDFSYSQENAFNVSSPPQAATAPQGPRPNRYHPPNKNPNPQRPIRNVPGSFTEPLDFDVQSQNTKAYHHPLPRLNGQAKSGGYRRDRRDSLDD